MPLSWKQMLESGFDRTPYKEDPPVGTWVAIIEGLVYPKGTTPGLHVYVRQEDAGDRWWLFVRWLGGNPTHTLFKDDARMGDRYRLTVANGKKSGKPYVEAVEFLSHGHQM